MDRMLANGVGREVSHGNSWVNIGSRVHRHTTIYIYIRKPSFQALVCFCKNSFIEDPLV